MTFDDVRQYLDNTGSRYGYAGTFDGCELLVNTPAGIMPIKSVNININEEGVAYAIFTVEDNNGNPG